MWKLAGVHFNQLKDFLGFLVASRLISVAANLCPFLTVSTNRVIVQQPRMNTFNYLKSVEELFERRSTVFHLSS